LEKIEEGLGDALMTSPNPSVSLIVAMEYLLENQIQSLRNLAKRKCATESPATKI